MQVILNTLDSIGYDTYFSILNASNFGVPQKRERVYFVSFRKDLRIKKSFQFPTSNGIYSTLKDVCLPDKDTAEFIINREDVTFKDHILLQQDILGHYPQKPIRIGQVNKGGQGERIYHELGHAITLSADGGGVGAKTGLYLINGKIRKLAPRECARITGFPDTFKLHSNKKNVSYKQFGNSVVTNVLEAVLANIFNTISF